MCSGAAAQEPEPAPAVPVRDVVECPPEMLLCGEGAEFQCVAALVDTNNCGGCRNVCRAGLSCAEGECVEPEVEGEFNFGPHVAFGGYVPAASSTLRSGIGYAVTGGLPIQSGGWLGGLLEFGYAAPRSSDFPMGSGETVVDFYEYTLTAAWRFLFAHSDKLQFTLAAPTLKWRNFGYRALTTFELEARTDLSTGEGDWFGLGTALGVDFHAGLGLWLGLRFDLHYYVPVAADTDDRDLVFWSGLQVSWRPLVGGSVARERPPRRNPRPLPIYVLVETRMPVELALGAPARAPREARAARYRLEAPDDCDDFCAARTAALAGLLRDAGLPLEPADSTATPDGEAEALETTPAEAVVAGESSGEAPPARTIVVIHARERIDIAGPARELGFVRDTYRSDEDGTRGQSVALRTDDAYVSDALADAASPFPETIHAAELVVEVRGADDETLWTYRRRRAHSLAEVRPREVLVRGLVADRGASTDGELGWQFRWRRVEMEGAPTSIDPRVRLGPAEESGQDGGALRWLARDFVRRLGTIEN